METNHPEGSRTAGMAAWPLRTPLLLAAALIGLITAISFARLLPVQAPRDPGEASEIMEAWRSLRGMPVYELTPDGHATHFYGALVPWVQGEIFRWVGPNNLSGRILSLVSGLAMITLIAIVLRTRGAAWLAIVVWAALLGLNHRTGQYFIENRPDMTALFFTTAALALMGPGLEKRRAAPVLLGTACLIVGFFFKQPASVFAAVPLVVLALNGRRPTRTEVLLAVTPMAAMIGVMLSLKLFFPAVYHYMIAIPGAYRIDWFRAVKSVWRLLLQSPLFLILVGEWLVADGGSIRKDRRMTWVAAMLVVAVPFCATAYGKYGGVLNSLLPAMLAMIAFCALRLPAALGRVEELVTSARARLALGSFAALLLLLTVFPTSGALEDPPAFDGEYPRVIATVAKLPGTVVCPKDPTIPLYAKEHAGRGLFPELDCHPSGGVWPSTLPETVVREVSAADFVVDIRDYWDDRMGERHLRELGFVPADELMPEASAYRLWRRGAANTADARGGPRTAWNASGGTSRERTSQD